MAQNFRYSKRVVAVGITATVGSRKITFKSKAELSFAEHLEFLRESGQIQYWSYEPHGSTFWFERIRRGVRSYKADFLVVTNSREVQWYEIKGYLDKRSVTKLKRMRKYYPHIRVVLVMMRDDKRQRDLVDAIRPFVYAVCFLDKVLGRHKGSIG